MSVQDYIYLLNRLTVTKNIEYNKGTWAQAAFKAARSSVEGFVFGLMKWLIQIFGEGAAVMLSAGSVWSVSH